MTMHEHPQGISGPGAVPSHPTYYYLEEHTPVQLRSDDGDKFRSDPLLDYQRGRRRVSEEELR